jgi:hypothetical protein
MPTNKLRFAAFAALLALAMGASVHAQSQATSGVQSSIVTVDELLKRENDELRARSKPAPAAAAVGRVQPSAPTLVVTGVYGLGGDVKANMMVNGQPSEGLSTGSRIGPCTVTAISGRCVALVAQRGTPPAFCTRVCWTGEVPASNVLPAGEGAVMPGQPGAVFPRPSPLPAPQTVVR